MLQSKFFTKVSRDFPKDEESKNAQLLIRAGFANKSSAGVYSYLPLGLRVLQKINNIVREEMNRLGAEEILMPALIKKEYWERSGRWGVGVGFRVGDKKNGNEFGLGWTHEEVISAIAKEFINSYKDLPKSVYQIQTKFRNEPRARAGLIRGREFLMKDLYSFHENKEDLNNFYEKVVEAYKSVFKKIGLEVKIVEAAGGEFTKECTHEFQVLHESGEDVIFYCEKCEFAQNKEIFTGFKCPQCSGKILQSNAIEVGNVFKLGTRYSEKFDLCYKNKEGKNNLVVMGSYGVGQSRILGTLVEIYNDEKGILWPETVAPFGVHLLSLGSNHDVLTKAKKLYNDLTKAGVEVLWDDRVDFSAGEKFNESDLLGIPRRVVISEKTLASGKLELKKRSEEKVILVDDLEFQRILK